MKRRSILVSGLIAAVLGLGAAVLPGVVLAHRSAPASTLAVPDPNSTGWEP
jgi:hypothetical protein